ncbi:MAG: hypothetical protein ACREE7_07735 [Dongiaceae bacterium]
MSGESIHVLATVCNIGLFFLAFLVLTITTQIGGVVLCLSWLVARWVTGARLSAIAPARPVTHVVTFVLL